MPDTIELAQQNGQWVGTYFGAAALRAWRKFGTDRIARYLETENDSDVAEFLAAGDITIRRRPALLRKLDGVQP